MGVPPEIARSAVRVSFGWNSTGGDVETFIAAWRRILERRRRAEHDMPGQVRARRIAKV
jgi:cysteine desulfurase